MQAIPQKRFAMFLRCLSGPAFAEIKQANRVLQASLVIPLAGILISQYASWHARLHHDRDVLLDHSAQVPDVLNQPVSH